MNKGAPIANSGTSGENGRRILKRDPNPHLFRPLKLRSVEIRNRIMLSPMCQYSAEAGVPNDWHFVHLGSRAVGGAGIVCTEAVHVEPRGRITNHCLGLWNDEQQSQLGRIAHFVSSQGAVPAIQLGHAGRKASVTRPWEGAIPLPTTEGGWQTVSSTARPYAEGWSAPEELDKSAIDAQLRTLASSARRARLAGFKLLELHAAHGYLIHQFYSPLSNTRTDEYGGGFQNRIRFLLESIEAIRSEWPQHLPMFLRLSVTDWVDGGWELEDSIALARILLERADVDLIDCSSGGNDPRQSIPIYPGYQIPLARKLKEQSGMPTGAVGLMHSADLAENVIASGAADIVILGRSLLADPVWPLRAAKSLKAQNVSWPIQYERSDIF